MSDHEHAAALEFARDLPKEAPHLVDAVAVALTARERTIDKASTRVELADRRTVEVAVVALAKACVGPNLDVGSLERDLRGLNGASQVGGEHAHNPVVPPSLTERMREASAFSRELARKPSRRDAALVVDRDRVRLVDEFNGNRLEPG
jgi:hypothetical protein